MRIKIYFTRNTSPVPFDYKELVTGTIYKWLGEKRDLYHGRKHQRLTVSDLFGSRMVDNHLEFNNGGNFILSTSDEDLIMQLFRGVISDKSMFSGIEVTNIEKVEEPDFNKKSFFKTKSMIFVKEDNKFYFPQDENFNEIIKNKVNKKLVYNGLESDDTIQFVFAEENLRIKCYKYKGISNKGFTGSFILFAKPETKKFLYENGIGSSTAIGFGCFE